MVSTCDESSFLLLGLGGIHHTFYALHPPVHTHHHPRWQRHKILLKIKGPPMSPAAWVTAWSQTTANLEHNSLSLYWRQEAPVLFEALLLWSQHNSHLIFTLIKDPAIERKRVHIHAWEKTAMLVIRAAKGFWAKQKAGLSTRCEPGQGTGNGKEARVDGPGQVQVETPVGTRTFGLWRYIWISLKAERSSWKQPNNTAKQKVNNIHNAHRVECHQRLKRMF